LATGVLGGALAALGTAAVMIGLVIGTWALAPHSGDASIPVGAGVLAWLLAHGTSAAVILGPGVPEPIIGTVQAAPLGGVLLLALVCAVSARRAAVSALGRGSADAWAVAGSVTFGYLLVAVPLMLSGPAEATFGFADVLVVAGVALAGSIPGAARGCRTGVLSLFPERLRAGLAGATAAIAVLMAGGMLVVLLAVLFSFGEVTAAVSGVGATLWGTVSLAILCVLAIPSAAVWVVAFATGPGFSLGEGVQVSATGVGSAELPAFPLFGLLPQPGEAPPGSLLLLVLPVAAGVISGLVARRIATTNQEGGLLTAGFLSGLFAGLGIGVLVALSQFSMGAQRLVGLGPAVLPVVLSVTVIVGGVAAIVAVEAGRVRVPQLPNGLAAKPFALAAAVPAWLRRQGHAVGSRARGVTGRLRR